MQFLKQSKKYFQQQLKNDISNVLRVNIKGLYKQTKFSTIQNRCSKCSEIIAAKQCTFCCQKNQFDLFEALYRNFRQVSEYFDKSHGIDQLLLLCIDKSGSMGLSYPSKYKKHNKEYIQRKLGSQNYSILSKIVKQNQLINNFEQITMLLQIGEDIRTVAKILQQQTLNTNSVQGIQKNQDSKQPKQPEKQEMQYIQRKDVIQNIVAKFIDFLKQKNPNALVSVVFFSDDIQIPTQSFGVKKTISNIENKTLEEMIQLGLENSKHISIQPVSTIGNKIINNILETQLTGGTALTPTIAFCLGLAQGLKSNFNQVIIFTDGLSNTGFGSFQQQKDIPIAKEIYKRMALDYALKNSCIFNIIGFQDSLIGYQDVLDQFIRLTYGIPIMIQLNSQQGVKFIDQNTFLWIGKEMIDSFGSASASYLFDVKTAVRANDKRIKLKCNDNMLHHLKRKENNQITFYFQLRAIREPIDIVFYVEQGAKFQPEQEIKFTVINSYKKKNKKHDVIREDKILIYPGKAQQADKSQAEIMVKEVKRKLHGTLQMIDGQTSEEYQVIQKKLQQNPTIKEKIDQELIQKFNAKMKQVQQNEQLGDKLSREKKRMQTRRTQTFKARQKSSESQDQEDLGGFI